MTMKDKYIVPTAKSIRESIERRSREFAVDRQGAGTHALLLLDTSGSMSGDKLSQAARGAVRFTNDAHEKGYEVTLATFNDDFMPLARRLTVGRDPAPYLRNLRARGGTDLTLALMSAGPYLSHSGSRTLCLVTDGYPNDANGALKAAETLKIHGIRIVCIGTDAADRSFLARVASQPTFARKVAATQLEAAVTDAARALPAPKE